MITFSKLRDGYHISRDMRIKLYCQTCGNKWLDIGLETLYSIATQIFNRGFILMNDDIRRMSTHPLTHDIRLTVEFK